LLAVGVAFAAAGEATAPLLLLAKLAASALIGLGLARGHRIDSGTHHLHRQGDDIDRRARETAREKKRDQGKGGTHVDPTTSEELIEHEWRGRGRSAREIRLTQFHLCEKFLL
jgi:hypothetical protein